MKESTEDRLFRECGELAFALTCDPHGDDGTRDVAVACEFDVDEGRATWEASAADVSGAAETTRVAALRSLKYMLRWTAREKRRALADTLEATAPRRKAKARKGGR